MSEPEPGADDVAPVLIETEEDLRDWIDGHRKRHEPHPIGICSCGWPHVPEELREAFSKSQGTSFPTLESHVIETMIGDLGNVIPSDTSDQDGDGTTRRVAWRPLVQRLYEELDRREREIDPRFVDLMTWCIREKGIDVTEIAAATVLHPHYLARLLNVPLPQTTENDQQPQAPEGVAAP